MKCVSKSPPFQKGDVGGFDLLCEGISQTVTGNPIDSVRCFCEICRLGALVYALNFAINRKPLIGVREDFPLFI